MAYELWREQKINEARRRDPSGRRNAHRLPVDDVNGCERTKSVVGPESCVIAAYPLGGINGKVNDVVGEEVHDTDSTSDGGFYVVVDLGIFT